MPIVARPVTIRKRICSLANRFRDCTAKEKFIWELRFNQVVLKESLLGLGNIEVLELQVDPNDIGVHLWQIPTQ